MTDTILTSIFNISTSIKKSFTKHPEKVGETYFKHMKQSMYLAMMSLVCFIVFFIHAIFPMIFQTTGSDTIISINKRVNIRRNIK